MRCFWQTKERGYTLIELLVSMAVSMVVLAALSSSFVSQSKALNAQELINEMQQNARAAMDLMAREIKMAGYDPNGIGFAAIETFGADEFRFRADLNGNNVTTDADEDLKYSLDAANNRLLRSVNNAAGVTIAENITALSFQYFMGDGETAAATAGDVRQILVAITARTSRVDPNTGEFQTYNVSSRITPNNLAF